jgi:hypothetical protein
MAKGCHSCHSNLESESCGSAAVGVQLWECGTLRLRYMPALKFWRNLGFSKTCRAARK